MLFIKLFSLIIISYYLGWFYYLNLNILIKLYILLYKILKLNIITGLYNKVYYFYRVIINHLL